MNIIVLCAGYATRLYPLTRNQPKPLLPINKRPIIEYILEKFEPSDGVENVYIITNHKFSGHFTEWAKDFDYFCPVEVIDDGTTSDDDKLGAIGDLSFVIENKKIANETVVVAGDNLFDFSIMPFIDVARHKGAAAAIGTFDVEDSELAKKYGIVDISDDGDVIAFVEKPDDPPSTFASLGLYHFSSQGIALVKEYLASGGNPDQPGHYIHWLVENHGVSGHVFTGMWFDIGDKDSYANADKFYSNNQDK